MVATMKKYMAGVFCAAVLCLVCAPSLAWADDVRVKLEPVAGSSDVAVKLVLPEGQRDEVRALSLALTVTGDVSDVQAQFDYAADLNGVVVKQLRSKTVGNTLYLKLYLAGATDLFEKNELAFGNVVLSGESGRHLRVEFEDLTAVNAAHSTPAFSLMSPDEPLEVTLGQGAPLPPSSGDDDNGGQGGTNDPSSPDDGNGDADDPNGGDPTDPGKPGDPNTPTTPNNPNTPDNPSNPDNPSDSGKGDSPSNGSGSGDEAGSGSGNGLNPGTNTSPGAPLGTGTALAGTDDSLNAVIVVVVALTASIAVALATIVRRRRN